MATPQKINLRQDDKTGKWTASCKVTGSIGIKDSPPLEYAIKFETTDTDDREAKLRLINQVTALQALELKPTELNHELEFEDKEKGEGKKPSPGAAPAHPPAKPRLLKAHEEAPKKEKPSKK